MTTCVDCGGALASRRALRCPPCAEKSLKEARYVATLELRTRGQCRNCYKPRGEDGTANHCRSCADASNKYSAARRRELRARGRCVACRKEHAGPGVQCVTCCELEASNKRARRAKGGA